MAIECCARAARRFTAIGLICGSAALSASCESPSPAPSKAAADVQAPSRVERETSDQSNDAMQGPAELAAEGVSVTKFTEAQKSALYVTMSIEEMEVRGDRYDITPAVAAAALAGMEFRIPSDTKARWGLIDITQKAADSNFIFTHRIGPSGVTYSMRHYDCGTHKVRYLATGETINEMRASKADAKMSDIVPGSITYYLGQLACTQLDG